jgi:hypothetical protein
VEKQTKTTTRTDESQASNDNANAKPLALREAIVQDDNGEETRKQHRRATQHLIG